MCVNCTFSVLRPPFTETYTQGFRDQVIRITSHELFSKSARYPQFLSYVVEKALTQQSDDLKERTIGIDVFGQPADYDTNAFPIVRYCASETRKRLALYYQLPEHQSELRIAMHPGKYIPIFGIPIYSQDSDSGRRSVMPVSAPFLNTKASHLSGIRIAVIPFANLNADRKNFFTNGITEQIIYRSASFHESFEVVAPPSTLHSKLASKSAAQLCHELKVSYFLAGSTLQIDGQVRVNVRLVGADGDCVWANSYLCAQPQVLAGQDRVACDVVRQLARILSPATGLECNIPEAQRALGLGMHLLEQNTEASVLKGIDQFRRSIELDDRLALGHCGLAFALLRHAWLGGNVEVETIYTHAMSQAQRAIEMAPEISWPYLVMATLQHCYDFDEEAAEENSRRALLADPGSIHAFLLLAFLNTTSGRFDDATNFARRAQEVEPYSAYVQAFFAFNFFCARRFDEALRAAELALQLDSNFPTALSVIGMVLEEMGQTDAAIEYYKHGLRVFPTSRLFVSHLGRAFALLGRKSDALGILQRLTKGYDRDCTSSYSIALINAALGRVGDTLEWVERSFADRCFTRVMCQVDPRFQIIDGSSRFRNLLLKARDESHVRRLLTN